MAASKSKKIWNFLDNIGGDKVVWIIALMLILMSIVCIFSSTSRLLVGDATRVDMVKDQLVTVGAGLVVILVCFLIRNINFFRGLSKWCFLISIALLLILDTGGIGPIKALTINGATRCLKVFGFQVHVFEIVKVLMIMYLAWAVDALEKDDFKLVNKLSELDHLHWTGTTLFKKLVFIYLPFVLTTVAILPGSNSSALFIGGIMFLTIVVGGGNLKDAMLLCALGALCLGSCLGLFFATKNSDHVLFNRIGTAISRTSGDNWEEVFKEAKQNKDTYTMQKALDKMRQPYSARIAIHQGGFLGKGPGQSTQRYVVPDMSEDYMFSFIVEEYGIPGALLVIILFVSLLARGSLIARNCGKNLYAKACVAGLTLLISGQAFMHMFVNADLGLLTGQTLPLISHGTSAFLCFCFAFGVILSISRIAEKKVATEIRKAGPLVDFSDNVEASLNELDVLDSTENPEDLELITEDYDNV